MDRLIHAITQDDAKVLFITGAGLSASSGIETFRGPHGKDWLNGDLVKLNEKAAFLKNPEIWWSDYWLKQQILTPEALGAKPSIGHVALAEIVDRVRLQAKVITQNIDTLHEKSGLDEKLLIHAHGSLDKLRCLKCHDVHVHAYAHAHVRCARCDDIMMPLVLMFDETYLAHSAFRYKEIQQWTEDANVIIFIGTSFSVGLTKFILGLSDAMEKKLFNINIVPTKDGAGLFDGGRIPINHQLIGSADEILTGLLARLRVN
jgi:NAD-dependent deacetylase